MVGNGISEPSTVLNLAQPLSTHRVYSGNVGTVPGCPSCAWNRGVGVIFVGWDPVTQDLQTRSWGGAGERYFVGNRI